MPRGPTYEPVTQEQFAKIHFPDGAHRYKLVKGVIRRLCEVPVKPVRVKTPQHRTTGNFDTRVELEREILRHYGLHKSWPEIEEACGVSLGLIRSILKKYNAPRRKRSPKPEPITLLKGNFDTSAEFVSAINEKRTAGANAYEIAQELDVSVRAVRSIMRKIKSMEEAGIELPDSIA